MKTPNQFRIAVCTHCLAINTFLDKKCNTCGQELKIVTNENLRDLGSKAVFNAYVQRRRLEFCLEQTPDAEHLPHAYLLNYNE